MTNNSTNPAVKYAGGGNVVVGLDHACNFRVMYISGKGDSNIEVALYPLDPQLVAECNYVEIFSAGIDAWQEHSPYTGGVKVVLPDSFVALDYFKVPFIKNGKNEEAVKVDYERRYINHSQLLRKTELSHSTKYNLFYKVMLVQDSIVKSIMATFASRKLSVQSCTYSAVGMHNAILALVPRLRKNNYLLVDINDQYTQFVLASKDKIRGYNGLEFGYEILSSDSMIAEHTIVRHEVSDLAVVNASEQAKAKKLSMAIDFDEPDDDDDDELTAEEQQQLEGVPVDTRKVHVKRAKVLPQFMRRPMPDTAEGVVYENFRIFIKYMLLHAQKNEGDEYMPPLEFVAVNMPEQYAFLIELANQELEDNGIELQLVQYKHASTQLAMHLDLYGANLLALYNKGQKII